MDKLVVKLTGKESSQGRVNAYDGAISLVGISKALERIGHYAATGDVRKRYPYDSSVRFLLEPPNRGSFEWIIPVILTIVDSPILGPLSTNILYDLIKISISSAIGHREKPESRAISELNKNRGGDVEALIDSLESPLKEAHQIIGRNANNIFIINGNNNKLINKLDKDTREYVNTTIKNQPEQRDVSVGSLNVNQKTGRVYFHDIKKTVPFNISNDATPRTITNLSLALNEYAKKSGATVEIIYEPLVSSDDRLKRIIIRDALPLSQLN